MQDHRVARRYASAMFEAARQANAVGAVESDLAGLVELLKTQPEFRHFMIAPYASREQKFGLLERVFGGRIHPLTMQLLRIMMEKRREGEITGVYEELVILRRAHENVAHVVITSAEALDDTQRADVVRRLESLLKKRVEPDFRVDPTILGGIRVRYENYILDGSVRGTLGRMKEKLKRDLLKQA